MHIDSLAEMARKEIWQCQRIGKDILAAFNPGYDLRKDLFNRRTGICSGVFDFCPGDAQEISMEMINKKFWIKIYLQVGRVILTG